MNQQVNHNVKLVSVDELLPYSRNSNTHPDAQIAGLAASIDEFGMAGALVVRDGVIGKGHGTLEAIKKIYSAGKRLYPPPGKAQGAEPYPAGVVPVLDASGWTDAQFRAFVIADNNLGRMSVVDDELLKIEIGDLNEQGFDLGLMGFDQAAIDAMLASAGTDGLTDPDDTPEVQAQVISKPGDVWVMGKHRIICGSSTDADTVAKVLGGVQPHLMVTDPPYGVEYDADWRNHALRADGTPVAGRAVGKVMNDDNADWREAWALFPGEVAYVWHAGIFSPVVSASLDACGFESRALIVWAKSNHTFGRGHYHHQHEPCWYAVRKGGTGHWAGDRKQTTLWQIPKPAKSETGHSTQKPVECMRRPIENNSSPGQAVYEPFSGSGTTIIAAEQTGRCCYAIELNPAYVDVAVRRWQEFTGGGGCAGRGRAQLLRNCSGAAGMRPAA
ncbi:site-specific DNA-methyltransferase [Malikia spinosa]|uniref:site-specific DNA-methyltransferase n=1 Tax=Malikia spinosa TaxID=86180 RepID=UPI002FDAC535